VAAARFASTAGGTEMTAFAFRELPIVDDASEVTANSDRAAALGEVATILNRRDAATLVIPGHLAQAKTIKLPVVASAQREKLIAFEAKQSIPFPLDEVFWDYQSGDDYGGAGITLSDQLWGGSQRSGLFQPRKLLCRCDHHRGNSPRF
jgi:hypothetical protein